MRLLPLALLLLLVGCSTTPPRPLPENVEQAWMERQQQLNTLEQWHISGRLAILTDHEGWHVSIDWQQQLSNYSIMLIAPLGQGSLKLDGDAETVVMQSDEGQIVVADDPDELLYQQFGWRVPVAALRYWVRGMPAPGEHESELDEHGRLAHLTQNGWDIRLLDYEEHDGVELPSRVFTSNHQGQVKLVISEWQLPQAHQQYEQ